MTLFAQVSEYVDKVDILLEVGVFSNLPNAQQSISPSTKNAKQANGNAKGVGQ